MNKWALCSRHDCKDSHVIPMNDLREHEFSEECWCKPVEDDDCINVYVHNSLDGREKFETGERQTS